MISVSEINHIGQLDALRPTWRRLWKATPGATFFQTLEWLETTWAHYPDPQKLRVVVVRRNGEPIGIVPFCVRTERRKVGALRALTYPLNDWGTFYSPLGPQPTVAFKAAIEHVAATPRDWDFIDLCWVDEASHEFLAVGEAMRDAGFGCFVRRRMEVRLARLEGDWDSYVSGKSHNWRRQMRRELQTLERVGPVRLLRYRPTRDDDAAIAEAARMYQLCEEISAKSWQAGDEMQSALCSPRVRDVLHSLHHQAASHGMLDVAVLLVGERPAAFFYNYVANGRVYGLRMGYDPTEELNGSGKILLYKMIEDSFRRGDVEYSFGPGRQAYKDRFATEMRHAYTFRHYARRSLRSQILRARESLYSRLLSPEAMVERELVT